MVQLQFPCKSPHASGINLKASHKFPQRFSLFYFRFHYRKKNEPLRRDRGLQTENVPFLEIPEPLSKTHTNRRIFLFVSENSSRERLENLRPIQRFFDVQISRRQLAKLSQLRSAPFFLDNEIDDVTNADGTPSGVACAKCRMHRQQWFGGMLVFVWYCRFGVSGKCGMCQE